MSKIQGPMSNVQRAKFRVRLRAPVASTGFGPSTLDLGRWTLDLGLWTLLLLAPCLSASAASRVKDITMVAGARDNQLAGYGLVTGIAGDGDKNPVYTLQTIANFLQRFGVNVPPATLSSKNVAA